MSREYWNTVEMPGGDINVAVILITKMSLFWCIFLPKPGLFKSPNCDFFQVISARKGEFETGFERGGQTREHAMLVKTAGVKNMIVLVNKMDDPTVNWDEER